jgi:hypothetical protein
VHICHPGNVFLVFGETGGIPRAHRNCYAAFLSFRYFRRKIRLIENTAKWRYLKSWPVKELCCSVYLSQAPSHPMFLFGVVKQFVGFESGQKESVKLLQNMISNTNQQPPSPPPSSHTLYTVYWYMYCSSTLGRVHAGGGEFERMLEGQYFITKLGRKYQHDRDSSL